MRINYLFSGIDKEKGFNKEQSIYLKEDIKSNKNIVFISSNFTNYEKNYIYYQKLIEHFNNIDITFNNTYLIDNRIDKKLAKEYINNSDIIFLMGGDTKLQMNSLIEYELLDTLKQYNNIIIGVSAGAMNQVKRVVYKNDYNNCLIEDYQGLGYFDINIYPHLDMNDLDYLKEILEVSTYTKTIALPNNSFVRIKDNIPTTIGEYYIIEGKNTKK